MDQLTTATIATTHTLTTLTMTPTITRWTLMTTAHGAPDTTITIMVHTLITMAVMITMITTTRKKSSQESTRAEDLPSLET